MKLHRIALLLLILITSCKSSKNVINVSSDVVAKKMSARKVSKKHIAASFDKQTVEAKLKVAYQDNKQKQKLSVKLRIDKDKVIWLNATYAGFLVARAKITPTEVSYYEKMNKTFFKGNFAFLKNVLGAEVNFSQLQNMLLGQTIFDLKAQKYSAVVNDNAHLLLPVKQKALFDILFWINPAHFKLDKQELKTLHKNQTLQVGYKKYMAIDGEVFPKNIEIRAKGGGQYTNIDIEYRTVVFNKVFTTPFKVPNGYKQVLF